MRRLIVITVAATAILAGLLGALPASAATLSAQALLGRLTVAAEAGAGSYDRAKFRHWIDVDRDGCDTREEVLLAESSVQVQRGPGCTVTKGRWLSVFDGRTWIRPGDVDIDHAVPLAEAWRSGARSWSPAVRRGFANDLTYRASLGVMTDNLNSTKQDRDPGVWLPPVAKCGYVTRWIAVKYRYHLSIDVRERAGLAAVLAGSCGARNLTVPTRVVGGVFVPVPVAAAPLPATPAPIASIPTATLTPTVAASTSVAVTSAPTVTTAAPTTPTAPITVSGFVWPGAFCAASDYWDYGYTSAGTLMRCTTTATDSRFRWRAA